MAEEGLGFIPANQTAPGDDFGFVPAQTQGSTPQALKKPEDLGFVPTEPDTSAMKGYVKENIAKAAETEKAKREPVDTSAPPIESKDFIDSVAAGWGMSVSGLMINGEKARIQGFQNQGVMMDVIQNISMLAGDAPAMIAGGYLGGAAGAAAGAAAGTMTVPVAGTIGGAAAGAAAGSYFGAGAMPQALRKIMMDHYEKGDIQTKDEFLNRLSATTWEALKGGGTNLAMLGAGKYAGRFGSYARVGGEVATMVGVSSALEGHLPDAKDFVVGAITVGGIHATVGLSSKLRTMYAENGELPHEQLEQIQKDVPLKQKVLGENPDTPIEVTPAPEVPEVGKSEPGKWVQAYDNLRDKVADSEGGKYYQRAMDDLASMKMIRDNTIPDVDPSRDPYKLARIYKGVDGKIARFERFDTLDFETGEKNGEGLGNILKDLPDQKDKGYSPAEEKVLAQVDPEAREGKNETWGKAVAYRLAKRALEKAGQHVETGVDLEAAKEVVKDGAGDYEEIHKRLVGYSERALRYLRDSGAVTDAEHSFMTQANKEYVPMYRLMDDDPFLVTGKGAGGPKRMTGSEKLIQDPFRTTQENAAAMVRLAEKQRIYQSLVELHENKPVDSPDYLQEKPANLRPIEVGQDEVKRFLQNHGFDSSEVPEEGLTIFRPRQEALRENEFSFKRDGKREVWQVLPEYADALRAIDYRPDQMALWQKLLTWPKKSLQTLTALSPDFIIRNPFRDQFTAATQSKFGQMPFMDVIESMGHLLKKDDVFKDYLSSGGMSGGIQDVHPWLDGDLFELETKTSFMKKAFNTINPVQALENVSHMAEQIPRLMEFKRSGGVGGTMDQRVEAAFNARNVTVDFSRSGAAMRVFSQYTPFVNAGLQGTDTFARAFAENPKKFTAMAVASVTIPSILTWLNGHNDSRYKDAPAWEKNLFWVLPTNKWELATSQADYDARPADLKRQGQNGELMVNNGVVMRLPKPFEVGILFGSLPERILERYADKNPKAFEEISDTIVSAGLPNFAPPAILAPVEQFSNHSFFRDTDIVSPHAEQMLPQDRFSEYTSETAKQIGKVLSYMPGVRDFGGKYTPLQAPAVVQNYLDLWGGTGGKYLVQLSDAALHSVGVGDQTTRAAWEWADMPFARAYLMKSPNPKSQPLRDFYHNYEFAKQVSNSLKSAMNGGDLAHAQQIDKEYGPAMVKADSVYKSLNEANQFLNNIQKAKINTNSRKPYTAEDKLQLMSQTYYQMNELAKAANFEIDKLKKTIEDKRKGQ